MIQTTHDLLHLDSTVPIGSIALGIADEDSDLDLCVLQSDLTKDMVISLASAHISTNSQYEYEESLLLHHSTLYNFLDTDVFVFKDTEKLAIIHKVMYLLMKYPKFVLRIKWIRVQMFRRLLIKEGFLNETTNRPSTDQTSEDF